MHAVDTNVLVRLIARDDTDQTSSAESFIGNGAWVSTLVLIETIWVLDTVYELTAREQATVIEMLLLHEHLVLQQTETVAAALKLFRARPSLGFSDCMMLETARQA